MTACLVICRPAYNTDILLSYQKLQHWHSNPQRSQCWSQANVEWLTARIYSSFYIMSNVAEYCISCPSIGPSRDSVELSNICFACYCHINIVASSPHIEATNRLTWSKDRFPVFAARAVFILSSVVMCFR